MKSISTFLLLSIAVCLAQTPIGIKQNTFTTNKDPSFVITGAVSNLLQVQQYYVVSGAGETVANGNYFSNPNGTWTNGAYSIAQYYGQPTWWLLNAPSIIPGLGISYYISQSGVTGLWTNYYVLGYLPFTLAGAPPCPKVTIAYTGVASYITASLLQNAGGLTVSNVAQYADTNGGGSYLNPLFYTLTPPSNTNLATQTQLAMNTNGSTLVASFTNVIVLSGFENPAYNIQYTWTGITTNAIYFASSWHNAAVWTNSTTGFCIWNTAPPYNTWDIGLGVSTAGRVYYDTSGATYTNVPLNQNGISWHILSGGGASAGVSTFLQASVPLALLSYAPPVMTNIDNTIYSNNPSHYLTPSATNGITQLGLSVVSVISNGVTFTTSNSVTQDTNTIISDGDAFYLLEAPFTNAFNGSYHSTQGVSFYLTNISGMYNQMTGGSKMGYSNTDGFVSTNWIHAGTPLTTNAYTYFSSITNSTIIATNSGTLIVSPIQTSTGIVYTLSLNVSNITYITNLNSVTLAGWGAFTTNSYSWQNYLAPVGDWQQATNYTNGLISATTAAATYQPAGAYLTPASSLNYTKFSNPPAIPTTNGLVTSNIFIGFATPAWVLLQNYLQSSNVAAYYAPTSSVISAIAPYPTAATLNASSNYLSLANTTNVNTIALHWGTNQALVASIIVNSNMTATFTTNSGVITVTLGSTTNLYASSSAGLQPTAANLTNWSGVPTNQILLTPNLVTTLVAGNNVTVTYTTNSSGVHATVAAQYQLNSPVQSTTAYIYMQLCATNTKYLYSLAASSGGSEPVYWPNALPAVPTTVKFYYQGADITSTVKALLTNFSASATSVTASGGCGSYSSLGQATLQMVGLCY